MSYEKYDLSDLNLFIEENKLNSKSRKESILYPRAYLYKYLKTHTDLTLEEIGAMFNREHSTVINGLITEENVKNDYWYRDHTKAVSAAFPMDMSIDRVSRKTNTQVDMHLTLRSLDQFFIVSKRVIHRHRGEM